MGVGPMTKGSPNWKLAPALQAQTQGLIASGFNTMPYGQALLLTFAWPPGVRGGAWFAALGTVVEVQDGVSGQDRDRSAALAVTWTGLQRMGLDHRALASFSRPFREGMFQEDRSRRLGDRTLGAWCDTVIPGGPFWSGNTPSDPADPPVVTKLTVHALLTLYTTDEADGAAWAAAVKAALEPAGVQAVHELELLLDINGAGTSSEHFGFADGLSQPRPYGLAAPADERKMVLCDGIPAVRDPVQGVPLGEILIGYLNGYSEPAPGPFVPKPVAAGGGPDPSDIARLPSHPLAEGCADLGLNGSYLVVRELKQDVAAFWTSLEANAQRLRNADPGATHITAMWLAQRVIGRSTDGDLLCPGGFLKPAADKLPDSDYVFHARDPHGVGCPAGSHVRRANPRDALAPLPTADSRAELLHAANNHRILRRGRKYGPKIADTGVDDGVDRGLLFMCLNTDIARQFEFVQQTWLLNTSFATLFGESDPLLGPPGPMTVRDSPLRRRVHVESYVRMAGGEYFFLPSIPALRYLSLL